MFGQLTPVSRAHIAGSSMFGQLTPVSRAHIAGSSMFGQLTPVSRAHIAGYCSSRSHGFIKVDADQVLACSKIASSYEVTLF